MQKTRREALDEFLAYVGESADSLARRIAEDLLSRAVEAIWLKHPWRDYQSPAPLELALVPGQRSYPLADYFGRLGKGRVRNLTRGTPIEPLDSDAADELYPQRGTSLETASTPRHYLLGGIVGVQRQPLVTGEDCQILMDGLVDLAGVRVTIVGADETGSVRRREFTPNGSFPVAVGTWSWIDELGKSFATSPTTTYGTTSNGTLTLRTAGGVVLQELFPEESAREHRVLTLLPKPADADVIAIPMMRRPPRFRLDGDPVPADWWNAIFEEMVIQWRVNRGELPVDSVVPRPHLIDLLCLDNVNSPRRRVIPFSA
jgi:hypothetical protein